jgi:hypothetical protein
LADPRPREDLTSVRDTYRYRSFFWPAVLILVGLIALLVNTGQIGVDRLFQLFDLWPLILIVIGVELVIRRTVRGIAGDVATALIVLLAIVFAAVYVAATPNPAATQILNESSPAGSLERVSVEISAGAATVAIADSADLGSNLYRAHVEFTGPKPQVVLSGGRLRIDQAASNGFVFQSRRFVLSLDLNPSATWTITQNSGAASDTINLPRTHVGAITLNTGASKDEITLGPPSGTVPVKINGGALTVHAHRPSGTKASIDVSGGAVSLEADGHSFRAVGRVGYQTGGLGADAYDIQVNGGACTVTLDTTVASG